MSYVTQQFVQLARFEKQRISNEEQRLVKYKLENWRQTFSCFEIKLFSIIDIIVGLQLSKRVHNKKSDVRYLIPQLKIIKSQGKTWIHLFFIGQEFLGYRCKSDMSHLCFLSHEIRSLTPLTQNQNIKYQNVNQHFIIFVLWGLNHSETLKSF